MLCRRSTFKAWPDADCGWLPSPSASCRNTTRDAQAKTRNFSNSVAPRGWKRSAFSDCRTH